MCVPCRRTCTKSTFSVIFCSVPSRIKGGQTIKGSPSNNAELRAACICPTMTTTTTRVAIESTTSSKHNQCWLRTSNNVSAICIIRRHGTPSKTLCAFYFQIYFFLFSFSIFLMGHYYDWALSTPCANIGKLCTYTRLGGYCNNWRLDSIPSQYNNRSFKGEFHLFFLKGIVNYQSSHSCLTRKTKTTSVTVGWT